jgi:hypothetical protein
VLIFICFPLALVSDGIDLMMGVVTMLIVNMVIMLSGFMPTALLVLVFMGFMMLVGMSMVFMFFVYGFTFKILAASH